MEKNKLEKREYNPEKEALEQELSRIMAMTLRLEDELNLIAE